MRGSEPIQEALKKASSRRCIATLYAFSMCLYRYKGFAVWQYPGPSDFAGIQQRRMASKVVDMTMALAHQASRGGASLGNVPVPVSIALVLHDEDEVKAGENGCLELDVLPSRLQVIIPAS